MPSDDRIAIRLTAEELRALDEKRHALRTKFQQVGYHLLMDWLKGDVVPANETERAAVAALLADIRAGRSVPVIPIERGRKSDLSPEDATLAHRLLKLYRDPPDRIAEGLLRTLDIYLEESPTAAHDIDDERNNNPRKINGAGK